MTALGDLLRRRIAATGPITLSEFMAECLLHPQHGYYTTRDPLGAAGDFTTAPEISQMFGELIGLALAQAWLDQGAPDPVCLAELGPGRGTLMADLLRATRAVRGVEAAAQVHLVERSPVLRAEQARRVGPDAIWHDDASSMPADLPLFLVANEFFDALPVRQFVRDAGGWRETMVALDETGGLSRALGPPAPLAALDHRLADTDPGDIVELCPALPGILSDVARRVAAHGGCALFIDYGGWRSLGDTVQAVHGHQYADLLETPGDADLTAHVDFEAVAAAARAAGAEAWGPLGQGEWLAALGIAARAEALARGLDDSSRLESHRMAFRRLTAPEEMGTVFKVMALTSPDAPAPAGFLAAAPEALSPTGRFAGPRGLPHDA
ncbi:MAG: SAM-dependent methyltransferase [Pseudomonadota bacterium]